MSIRELQTLKAGIPKKIKQIILSVVGQIEVKKEIDRINRIYMNKR
jgi:hypothetical protein